MISTLDKKWLYPLLTFMLTVSVTLCIGYFFYQSQQNYTQTIFENLAERQTEVLTEFVVSDLEHIGAGANFFHATDREDWNHFPAFAKHIVGASQTLTTLQWMERVEPSQIDDFLSEAREENPDFQIYTIPKGGVANIGYHMPANEPIFVARDVYPRDESNQSVLGFYSSRVRFQLVLDHMRIKHEASVSDKVRLLQDGVDTRLKRDGILVYHPVFDQEKHQKLIGVVIGIIRTSHYFDNLMLRTAAEQKLEVRVVDLGFDAHDDPVLFESQNWAETDGFEVSEIITLPNRKWSVTFRLGDKVTANDRFVLSGFILSGFVIACLLSYIVFLQARAKSKLQAQLAARTKELQFLVEHDSLTGLYSRHAFNKLITKIEAEDIQFTFVALDIDRFKSVNDNYGHMGGDQMLVHVAHTVQGCLAPGDIMIRCGGDEFYIISYVIEKAPLKRYLELICHTMANSQIMVGESAVSCTLSIGASIRANHSVEQLIHIADAELYKSKKAGRNSVSIAE